MMSTVRPAISRSSASWTTRSLSRVERAGRLVQQQDRPVGEDGARDRETLALAAGQPHAALAEIGFRNPAAARSMNSVA